MLTALTPPCSHRITVSVAPYCFDCPLHLLLRFIADHKMLFHYNYQPAGRDCTAKTGGQSLLLQLPPPSRQKVNGQSANRGSDLNRTTCTPQHESSLSPPPPPGGKKEKIPTTKNKQSSASSGGQAPILEPFTVHRMITESPSPLHLPHQREYNLHMGNK